MFESAGATGVGGSTPAPADLEERDDEFVVDVEVPGFDREEIQVDLDGRRHLAHAERSEQEHEQEPEGTMRASTRTSGHLYPEVVLPAEVDRDGFKASVEQGVLNVRRPTHRTATLLAEPVRRQRPARVSRVVAMVRVSRDTSERTKTCRIGPLPAMDLSVSSGARHRPVRVAVLRDRERPSISCRAS